MKKEETNINSRKHSVTVQRASRSLYLMPHTLYLNFIFYILYLILGSSCHYPRPDLEDGKLGAKTRDSLAYLYERHYTWNTNLEVQEDSVTIACLPVKDCYNTLYKGDRVVVAEFAIHPTDSVDSVWVKLAHSQEVQGWLREKDMIRAFVPTDSISQAIYLFSDTHASYFIVIFALFVAAWLFRAFRRKQLQMVYFNDIDSVYPLLLCLLLAFSATVYESMQVFVPETWQHFYFNPTLSPFKVPFVLSVFLMSLWLFVIVLLAVLDDLFRQLSPEAAVFSTQGQNIGNRVIQPFRSTFKLQIRNMGIYFIEKFGSCKHKYFKLGMAENEKRLPKSNLFTRYLNILTKKNKITASGTSQALCI